MASVIEHSYALRTIPGTGDKVGTTSYVDPLTGDAVKGEQTAQYGYPTRWVKVADKTSTLAEYPSIGAITITSTGGAVTNFALSGALPAGSPVGLLAWITNAGSNLNLVRKLVSISSGTIYNVNQDWAATPGNTHTYALLIHTFRFNSLMIKTEFSGAAATCKIRPFWLSVNQDLVLPTPTTGGSGGKPIRYIDQEYILRSSGINTSPEETSYYHGEILSLPAQGSLGAILSLTAVSAGTVSIWAAGV